LSLVQRYIDENILARLRFKIFYRSGAGAVAARAAPALGPQSAHPRHVPDPYQPCSPNVGLEAGWASPDVGPDQFGLHVTSDQSGLHVGPDQSGLHVGPDQSGLHVGPDQSGLHVGPDQFGLRQACARL
jgi:hypothetical protein